VFHPSEIIEGTEIIEGHRVERTPESPQNDLNGRSYAPGRLSNASLGHCIGTGMSHFQRLWCQYILAGRK
jgi:hypothetical protein